MANDIITQDAINERKRIHDAFRRIVARYEFGRDNVAELVIRRAIEEVFEGPIPDATEIEQRKRR